MITLFAQSFAIILIMILPCVGIHTYTMASGSDEKKDIDEGIVLCN